MKPNTWAMLCHLSGLTGYLGNGLGSIVAPLILWLIKKDEMPMVDYHGKEALNFNISVGIYYVVLGTFAFITFGLGIPLLLLLALFHIICVIQATIKANDGEAYRYPFCIRLVK